MAAVTIYPYLRPEPSRFEVSDWRMLPDESVPGEYLPDWDPGMSLNFTCDVRVDLPGIFSDCRLHDASVLCLGASWYSPGTGLRGCGTVHELHRSSGQNAIRLQIPVAGYLLASEVVIRASLFLSNIRTTSHQGLAPSMPGAQLWETQRRIAIEGRGARFPIEPIEFSKSGWLPPDACWHLDWNPDSPEGTLLGTVRLLVNLEHSLVRRVFGPGTSRSQSDEAVISAMYFDVGRQIINGMLANDEFVSGPERYVKGTVGYHARGMFSRLFPDESLPTLRARWQNRRQYFESELQARFRLFRS